MTPSKGEVSEGVRAIIKLTATETANEVIAKHKDDCSVSSLWQKHDKLEGRTRRMELTLAVLSGSGLLGGSVWGLVKLFG